VLPTAHIAAAAKCQHLAAQSNAVLCHVALELRQRWRWLSCATLLGASVRFATLSQAPFVMSSQATGEECMFLFMMFYVASLAFIVSFDA